LLIPYYKNNTHSTTKQHPCLFQNIGCAMAQAVSSQISIVETWDQLSAVHMGYLVEVVAMGQVVLRVL
jgi:hypothetical protein